MYLNRLSKLSYFEIFAAKHVCLKLQLDGESAIDLIQDLGRHRRKYGEYRDGALYLRDVGRLTLIKSLDRSPNQFNRQQYGVVY